MRAPRWFVGAVIAGLGMFAIPVASASAAGNPLLAGSVSNSTSLSGALSVAVSGSYAYMSSYYGGELVAVSIANPAAPVVAGASAFSSSLLNASTVNISGPYAYVVSKNRNATKGSNSNDDGTGNSLTIVNIGSNPAQPTIVGKVTDATKLFGAYGVAVSGSYAYVAAQGCLNSQPCPKTTVGSSFEVVNVSNPAKPAIVAGLSNSALPAPWTGTGALAHACAVTISGHYAYVTAAYSNRLTIIDISNPLAPKIVASLKDPAIQFPVDVAVQGNDAYVADQSGGKLAVVDVTTPTAPHVVASVTNSTLLAGAYRVRVRGNFAYVAASSHATVTAVDISNPLKPRIAGSVTDGGHLNHITGLDIDPTSRYVYTASPLLSSQSNPLYPPFPPAPKSPTITGTVAAIQLDPAAIGVTIAPTSEPSNPTTQTTANFTFSTTDVVSSLACSLDGAPATSCTTPTSQSYTLLSAKSHTFTVQATDAAGHVATATYTWTIT